MPASFIDDISCCIKRCRTQFKESELARSIPQAYEAVNVRREVYEVLSELRSDVGPFAAGA